MQTLLYATDFSNNAENAFPPAYHLAKTHGAALIMAHVFEPPTSWEHPYTEEAEEMEREEMEEAEEKLKALFQNLNGDDDQLDVDYIVKEERSISKGLLTILADEKPDIIVLGMKGASKAKDIIVGSTTRILIGQSPVPVLAVPENAEFKGFDKILYATDFREEDFEAIRLLVAWTEAFSPEITIAHITKRKEYEGDENMEWFREQVEKQVDYEYIDYQLLLSDHLYKRLNDYLERYPFDLLVMLEKEKKGLIDQLFHRDIVKRMEYHRTIPLLSFNEHFLKK